MVYYRHYKINVATQTRQKKRSKVGGEKVLLAHNKHIFFQTNP